MLTAGVGQSLNGLATVGALRERGYDGELPLRAITQLDVRAWVADLDASGRAPATVQKAYQTLSKIL